MDLRERHSRRYVTGVYAVFIILFAFTLLLFYTSRCQKSPRLDQQDIDNIGQKDSTATKPIKPETIDSPKRRSKNKIEISKSDNEKIKVPLFNQTSEGKNIEKDDYKTPSATATNQKDNQIQVQPPLISSNQNPVIYFSAESTGLTDEALQKLKSIYLVLAEDSDVKIIIEGYADSSKTDRNNQNLSKLRANIVKGYFVKRGISNSRIETYWMGSENPAGSNLSKGEGNKNHQVEIRFKFRSQE